MHWKFTEFCRWQRIFRAAAALAVVLAVATTSLALAQGTSAPAGSPQTVEQMAAPEASRAPPTLGHAALPRDLSPWGMFINADIVVKAIMIGLMFASLVTWTGWLAKSIELASAKRQARAGLLKLQEARSLPDAERKFGDSDDTVARLVRTASAEVALSGHISSEGLKERVAWLLERLEVAAGRRIGRGLGVLASIGATAPFVGLLGTVWGIMNSFIGISNAHTTNLAVVAPGIAEALLATALGLFAAIPAVVIYNVFARSAAGYRMLIADAGALVLRLVSRDSERGAMPLSRAAE
jgi:biopolymer transport protein ExbB